MTIEKFIQSYKELDSAKILPSVFSSLGKDIEKVTSAMKTAGGGFASIAAGANSAMTTMLPLAGAITIVGAAFAGFKLYKAHVDALVTSAKDAGNAWEDQNTSLQANIDRIAELRTALASGTLSEQEAYDAKAELLSIQQSLSASYGEQAEGINLVNGSLDEQIAKVKELQAAQSEQLLNENAKGIDMAVEAMEKNRHTYLGQLFKNGSEEFKTVEESIKRINDKYGEELFTMNESADGVTVDLHFNGDAKEAKAALNDFMTDMRDAQKEIGESDILSGLAEGASYGLNEANEVLDKYQDLYRQAKEAELYTDKNDFGGKSASDWLNSYADAIERYNEALSSGDSSKIAEAKTEFDGINESVQSLLGNSDMSEYVGQFEEVGNQLNTAAIKAHEFNEALAGKGLDANQKKLKDTVDEIKKLDLDDVDFKAAIESGDIDSINFLAQAAEEAGVSTDDLANSLIELGAISGKPAAAVEETAESLDTLTEKIANVKQEQANLMSALSGSRSATGMTAEEINNVTKAFEGLDNFNPQALFERTAHGVHLNTEALEKYNAELEQQYKNDFAGAIAQKQKELNEAQANNSPASVIEGLQGELQTLQLLATEYAATTSSYNKFVQASSAGKERDSFANVANSYEGIGKLIEQGWTTDESVTSYLDLLLGTDRIQDSKAAYAQLGQTIEGVGHSLKDYMTYDSEGNFTSQGAWMFVDDIASKLGEDFVTIGENSEYALDLTGDKLQTVADEFGTTTEFVELLGRALADAGMEVSFDSEEVRSYNEKMQELAQTSADTQQKLQELQSSSEGNLLGDIDLNYDKASMSIDDIEAKISELSQKKAEIDVSTEEGQQAVEALNNEISSLQSQKVMLQIGAQLEAGHTVEELLGMSDAELQATLNIDSSQVDAARQQLESLQNKEVNVPITVKLDETQFSQLTGTENMSVHVKPVVDEAPKVPDGTMNVTAKVNEPPEVPDATGTANMQLGESPKEVPDASGIANFRLGDHPTKAPDIFGVANYRATFNFSLTAPTIHGLAVYTKVGAKASGTMTSVSKAHANGTAYNVVNLHRLTPSHAGGRVALSQDEKALVNELGTESIIRDGVWSLLPGKMHVANLKKGDIILNAEQTKQLLNTGAANSYARAYAAGSLYNGMHGYSGYTGHGKNPWATSGGSSGGGSYSPSYGGGSSSGGAYYPAPSSSTPAASQNNSAQEDDDSEIIDWIEIAINRIERAINRLATIATSPFKTIVDRLLVTDLELDKIAEEISLQRSAYARYMQEANSVGLDNDTAAKVQNGTIDITKYDKDTAEKIKSYQEYYEKALACEDAISELDESIAELYQNKFDDLTTDFDNQLALYEHMTNSYNNGIADLEERGYIAGTKYYEAMQNVERTNISTLKSELEYLINTMSDGVNSGAIKEGSEAWHDMQQQINSVKESIQESETEVVKLSNSIREIEWGHFDYLQEQISNLTEEADFMIDLMENSHLFTDKGKFTDTGMATLGLHGQNYNVYMAQADKYAEEIQKLNAEIAKDPNNTILLERREELLEAQRDSILAAEDEKMAIHDLVKEGIEIELDALQELIDRYNEALDSAKDMYDYQKKVKQQTSEIASLQKQLSAYAGDDSEEAKSTIQKLEVDLSEAMEDLEETQYEHYISDQKKLLDNLYNEYEMILNQRLDNIDALISQMIDVINTNASTIYGTLISETDKVGYTISENERMIWANGGAADTILAKYGDNFLGAFTSVNAVLNSISSNVARMVAASEQKANTVVSATTPTTSVKKPTNTQTNTNTSQKEPAKPSTSNTQNTAAATEQAHYGVALAIWNGNHGWGAGDARTNRLKSKGFDPARVQAIVNQMGKDGYVLNGTWPGKYYGITDPSQYHFNKFRNGGLIDYTGIAQVDGTPGNPELVLNAKDTENFIKLKDALRSVADGSSPLVNVFGDKKSSDIVSGISRVNVPSVTKSATTIGEIKYEINMPIDHVLDYNDIMNHMQKDNKFQKMIKAMTIDPLYGGSQLAKNKYRW